MCACVCVFCFVFDAKYTLFTKQQTASLAAIACGKSGSKGREKQKQLLAELYTHKKKKLYIRQKYQNTKNAATRGSSSSQLCFQHIDEGKPGNRYIRSVVANYPKKKHQSASTTRKTRQRTTPPTYCTAFHPPHTPVCQYTEPGSTVSVSA